jgi:hypothetical protein
MQVNLVWASDGRSAARDEAIVAAANALRDHFQAQRLAPPDQVVANRQVGENAFLVFRAAQADGRMGLPRDWGCEAGRGIFRACIPVEVEATWPGS